MLHMKRRSQMDKLKDAVRDAVAYLDDIAADENLRDDVRAAFAHGTEARDRIRKDVGADNIATQLANDRKLRKKVRAMLEDLGSAGERIRHRKRHRLRNALLFLGSLGAIAALGTKARRWFADRMSGESEALSTSV